MSTNLILLVSREGYPFYVNPDAIVLVENGDGPGLESRVTLTTGRIIRVEGDPDEVHELLAEGGVRAEGDLL